tara:strand:+ start:14080 stop:14799 length:720 start_codon:yes stop_codon:yes gene_type:complete
MKKPTISLGSVAGLRAKLTIGVEMNNTENREVIKSQEFDQRFARDQLLRLGVPVANINLLDHFLQIIEREDESLPEGEEIQNLELRVHGMALAIVGFQTHQEKIHYVREYFYSNFNHPVNPYFAESQADYQKSENSLAAPKDTAGWVYILSNPSMPGVLKIGMTQKSVELRIKQLSAPTGVAAPFECVWSGWSNDCISAESLAHKEFDHARASGKEFFHISKEDAVAFCRQVCNEGVLA